MGGSCQRLCRSRHLVVRDAVHRRRRRRGAGLDRQLYRSEHQQHWRRRTAGPGFRRQRIEVEFRLGAARGCCLEGFADYQRHFRVCFDGSVAMRRFLLAAVIFGVACGAQAADMPDFLRGSISAPAPTRNWDGWYVGGQVSYSAVASDFSKSVVGLTNFIFRDSVLQQPTSQFGLLAKTTTQGTGFGGFVGRNYQLDDLVFGVEANYNYFDRLTTSTSASNSLEIVNPSGQSNPPRVTG